MINIGNKYKNSIGLEFQVLELVEGSPKYNYKIKFLVSGSEKIVNRKSIETGSIKDDYNPNIYGIAYKGDIKCISTLEKKAFSNWYAMISRCYNTSDINYSAYGGREISVSEEWRCFKNFYEDLPDIDGYSEELYLSGGIELDKDYKTEGNKVYCKDSCQFITKSENRKKQPSKQKTIVGIKEDNIVEFYNLHQFAKENNLREENIREAIIENKEYNGWRFQYKQEITVFVTRITEWNLVLDTARLTINKDPLYKIPSEKFKSSILLAEHSPIRTLQYMIEIKNIPSWVSQHIARHDAFAYHTVREGEHDIHFVGTQRSDRTGLDRGKMPQDSLVNHTIYLNSQDLINISRKRLCFCASPETRAVWKQIIEKIREIDPTLASKCVPECLYRGFCPEFMSTCKYSQTLDYQKKLVEYRRAECDLIWKQLPENSKIEISNFGDLRKSDTLEILKTVLDKEGYLYYNDNGIVLYPHILVYRLFSSEPDDTICGIHSVYHLDSNKINNNIKNLKKKE